MRGRGSKVDTKRAGGTRTTRRKVYVESGVDSPDSRGDISDLSTSIKAIQQDSVLKMSKPISPTPSESSMLLNSCITKSSCTSPENSSIDNSKDIDILSGLDATRIRDENLHLKELLISQLDLIQQQSETILSRDKQLKDLRMENENLRLRLERMERRVRNDTDSPQSSRSKEPRKRGLRDMSPGDHVPNKRIKQEVEDVKEPQAQQNCLPEDLDRTVRADIPKIPRIAELQDEILVESDDVFMRNKRSTGTLTEDSMEAEGDVKLTVSDKSIKLKRERPKQKKISKSCPLPMTSGGFCDQLLQTPYHFFVGCGNEIVNNDDKLNDVAVLQRGIEVPRFRRDPDYEKKMSRVTVSKKNPQRSKDIPEAMDDETYLKRHEKHEANEKKLKKRDMQRMRESLRCEKLRLREKNRNSSNSKKVQLNSLLPIPEGALSIEVVADDKVPVFAFGQPVPSLDNTDFVLPWLKKREQKKRRHHI